MAEDEFEFKHLETKEDIEQNLDLMRRVYGESLGVDRLVTKLIDYHPTMTLHDFFVIKHKDKMVASLNLIPVAWSIGGIPLKVAEMGCVATLPEYRRKGLIRKLVNEYHKRVQDQAYDLSVIEGIPYFYRQFGYEYALPLLEETRINLNQIPDYEPKCKIRPFADKDIPKAMRLLFQSQKKFYVHSIRDQRVWRMQQKTCIASDPEPFVAYAVEEDEEMIAYFRLRESTPEKELILTEVTNVDQLTAQTILRFLKDMGMQHGFETVSAHISYQESLTEHAVAIGGSKRFPPYAWQVRITNYRKIFLKLKPLFEKRLASSTYSRLTQRLNFNFCLFTVRMTAEEGVIMNIERLESIERSPISMNPLAFVQLLLGHRDRNELEMIYPDFRIDAKYRHLIDVLFPKLPSYIHSAY